MPFHRKPESRMVVFKNTTGFRFFRTLVIMANRTKFTVRARKEFLKEVAKDSNIARSCRYFNISRRTVYDHRDRDPKFAKALEAAVEEGIDNCIDEARRRAFRGCSEPVFYKGKVVGFKKEYSDRLAEFLIKGKRPEYRDRLLDIPDDSRFRLILDYGSAPPTDDKKADNDENG